MLISPPSYVLIDTYTGITSCAFVRILANAVCVSAYYLLVDADIDAKVWDHSHSSEDVAVCFLEKPLANTLYRCAASVFVLLYR